jgi:hypothetical protein
MRQAPLKRLPDLPLARPGERQNGSVRQPLLPEPA